MAAADKEDLAEKARIARLRATNESIKLANQKKSEETAKEATEKVLMEGGKSTDKANRLPGETASEANDRITKAYKELTAKPVLSQEQIDAGAKVQFVRTGAGGVGEWAVVVPPGYKGERTTTQWTDGIIPGGSKYTTGSSVGTKITGGKVSTATATTKDSKTEGTGSKFQNTFAGQQAARIEKLRADAAAGKKITLQDLGDFRTIYYDKDPVTGKQRTGKEVVDAMLADLNLVDPNELLKSGGTTLVNEQTKEVRPQNLAEIKQNILEQIAYEAKSQSRYSSYAKDVYNYLKGNASQGIRGILAKDPTLWKGGYSPADVGKIVAGKSSDPNDKRSVYIIDPNNPVIPEDILAQIQGQNIPIIDPTTGNAVGFDPRTRSVVDFGGSFGRVTPRPGYDYLGNYIGGANVSESIDEQGNIIEDFGSQFGATKGSGTSEDPLLINGNAFNGVLGGVTYTNGVAQNLGQNVTDFDTKQRKSAQQDFLAALNELGLGDLYDEVNRMITEDKTVATIKLELPKTEAYKQRFPGMEALRKAGRAISEAVYISNEKGYLQTLRAYGLDSAVLGSRSELGKYIANEVSPREFEERVNIAATRVKENPDVIATFKSYFPEADEGGVIAYLLNPKAGMDIIKKQIRVSEIGAAATKAGFARDLVGAKMAESLISAVGDTGYAQIATEFQRARQLANNQRRLAQIEGQQYTDLEAISAVVGDDVTSALASQRRAEREAARFGGAGGVSGASLRSTTAI